MPKYRYCFVITYGRSGSTLLQGILNSIDGYLIRGENGGVMTGLYRILLTAQVSQRQFASIGRLPSDPWYGIDLMEREQLLGDLRKLFVDNFIRPEPEHVCIGCKEIRWGPEAVGDLATIIDFIEEAFPKSCLLFNSRNLQDVSKSGWWKERPDAIEYVQKFEARMRAVYERNRENYFWVNYDDYVNDPEGLRPLFDFLGEPFMPAALAKVLNVTHGSRTAVPPKGDL